MGKRALLPLVLVAGLLLAGCAPHRSSRTCEEIRAADLRAVVEGTMSVEQAVTRIAETFHVAGEDVKVTRSYDDPNFADIVWGANGVSYRMTVRSPRILSASMSYESNAPTVDQVIECLGSPERYWAFYRPPLDFAGGSAKLSLVYPALGLECVVNKPGRGYSPPRFDGDEPIDTLLFVPPGAPDEVTDQLLDLDKGWEEEIRREMKPWPGDWSQVEVHGPGD